MMWMNSDQSNTVTFAHSYGVLFFESNKESFCLFDFWLINADKKFPFHYSSYSHFVFEMYKVKGMAGYAVSHKFVIRP